ISVVPRPKLTLLRQSEDSGRVGAAHRHPAVQAEPAGPDAEMMNEGQARLNAGDAPGELAGLTGMRAVVARDDVERAVCGRLPQGGLVAGLPDGRAHLDRVAALERARVVRTRVHEIGHAHLAVDRLSARLRRPNLAHTLLGALMVEEQARAGLLGEGDDAM